MNQRRVDPDVVSAVRQRVKAAWAELRNTGFITKTNFSCCMSCAIAELGEIASTRRRNRAVYWHRQDEEHFRKTGELYIRFCYLPRTSIDGDTTPWEKQIGEKVADALRKQGLELDWNGSPGVSIRVTGLASPEPAKKESQDE